jgi:hypothetical protein
MTLTQLGKSKQTKRSTDPALRFDLYTRPGDANIKSLAVTLPTAFAIDQRHLGNICSESELINTKCAGRQAIGKAFTKTPLLDAPLSGPVYAVSGGGGLPRLAFILDGQVSIMPRAETKSNPGGALRTVVPTVPDAPIGHFRFTLFGGKAGYIVNTRDLCTRAVISTVEYTGQNGKQVTQRIKAKAPCSKHQRRRGT